MQVYPISDNQQTFKGYIQNKLKKNIRKNLLKSSKYIEHRETDFKKEKYRELLEQGERMFEKLEKFVAPMHKDTTIGIDKYGHLFLSNPIFTNKAYIAEKAYIVIEKSFHTDKTARLVSDKKIHTGGNPYINSMSNLEYAEEAIDAINKCIKPEEIDEAFLKLAENDLRNYRNDNLIGINIIDKFLINRVVKRIEKYAKSIGKTTDARKIAEERLQELEEMANKQKTENKTKSGMIQPSKKKKTPEDKHLTRNFISKVLNLGKNTSANIQTTSVKSPEEIVQK